MFRRSDKTAYQYAAVFRYVLLKQIACDVLAEELRKNGIAELADRFSREFGTNQRTAASNRRGRPTEPGDDDDDPEADDEEDDGEVEEDDAASDPPEVDWTPKALNKLHKINVKGGVTFSSRS
jgi:hypothetical protein